jgi:hypothetical protein
MQNVNYVNIIYNYMKRIAIFGCGIGGLTVAHELSKNPKYKIDMYEKKNVIGGLARSSRDQDNCATEYCWRAYFSFYDNLFKIMSEIPLIEDQNKTVLNNLTHCSNKCLADKEFTIHDKIIGIKTILYGMTSCDERLDELDNLSWWKSLKNTDSYHLLRSNAAWLGADRYSCSYRSVIKVGFEMDILAQIFYDARNYISTKPTSEAWFNHWKRHLLNQSVKIHFNSKLTDVYINNNNINGVIVNNNIVTADYYVFALPVEILDEIINKTPKLQKGDFLKINKLKNISLHMQLSFQLYFTKSISLGTNEDRGENNTFFLVDTPWDLIILQYDKIYRDVELCNMNSVKGGWSCAVCTAYVPGIVFGKPFNECTYPEIIEEIWMQMYTCKKLQEEIFKCNGFYLEDNLVVKWSPMWPTYKFDEDIGKIVTSEPKFTNNIGSYELRPSYLTCIDNMFISTAYIKETIDIFSTEAAAIAGKYVANAIAGTQPPVLRDRPIIFSPFRKIDSIMKHHGFPNIGPSLIIIMIIVVIYSLYHFFKKK